MATSKKTNTEEEDALEQWAISDDREVREDAVVMGSTQEERDEMREVLRSAASEGQKEALDRFSKGGRPRLSPGEGRSPMWRVRAPQPLHDELNTAAESEDRNVSDLVRDAVEQYLAAHHRTPTQAESTGGSGLVIIGEGRDRLIVRSSKTGKISGGKRFTTVGNKKRTGKTVTRSAITGRWVSGATIKRDSKRLATEV